MNTHATGSTIDHAELFGHEELPSCSSMHAGQSAPDGITAASQEPRSAADGSTETPGQEIVIPGPRLLALTGPAGCGKTTLAGALEHVGWVRLSFAEPIRAMIRAFLTAAGHTEAEAVAAVSTAEGKASRPPCLRGRSVREALQSLGTEWGRAYVSPEVWTALLIDRASSLLAAGKSVVVDDLRFPIEAEAVRHVGGVVVRLDRPGADLGLAGAHASEIALPAELVDVVLPAGIEPAEIVAALTLTGQPAAIGV